MSHYYTSESYISASEKLDEACGWLEKLGIEYSRTRIGKYKALFSELAMYQSEGKLDSFFEKYTFEEWVNAAHETAEFVRMYEGLNFQNDCNLVSRLHDALKGHELYILDTNDRSGRDFSFELTIAAKFSRSGYKIDFGHEADLKVIIKDFTFFVECKRLKSARKIQKRIKEGIKQLHKRYVKAEVPMNARGILALSINKPINQKLGLLEGDNPKILGEKAFEFNRNFIENYKKYWQIKIDKRTLGVAIVLDSPGIIKSTNQLVTCHEVTVNNSAPEGSREYFDLLEVAQNVFTK